MTPTHWATLGALASLVGALLAAAWFAAPPANPSPRAGAALPGGVVIAWSPAYRVSFLGLERLHPFDVGKSERVAAHLIAEGLVAPDQFAIASPISDEQLAAVHDPAYLASLHDMPVLSAALELELPDVFPRSLVEQRVRRPFRLAAGGTELAVQAALQHGVGVNLGGGFHHARPGLGHGFCVYNDVAWAIYRARVEGFTGRVLIVDTDAHQGDGNHAYFADDPLVFSFSMHGEQLFPEPKLIGDRDVGLPPGIDDATFLALLDASLDELLSEGVDLLIHVAGADVLADDPLANLALSIEGLVERDRRVFDAARDRDIPMVHLLAGGYGPSAAIAQARSVAGIVRAARSKR